MNIAREVPISGNNGRQMVVILAEHNALASNETQYLTQILDWFAIDHFLCECVSVYVCVCMSATTHLCRYLCTLWARACVRACARACVCVCVYMYVYAFMYVCNHTLCRYVCVCVCV